MPGAKTHDKQLSYEAEAGQWCAQCKSTLDVNRTTQDRQGAALELAAERRSFLLQG